MWKREKTNIKPKEVHTRAYKNFGAHYPNHHSEKKRTKIKSMYMLQLVTDFILLPTKMKLEEAVYFSEKAEIK